MRSSAIAACLGLIGLVFACGCARRQGRLAAPVPVGPDRPTARSPLAGLLGRLEGGAPVRIGRLTVMPIHLKSRSTSADQPGILVLAEAMERRWAWAAELPNMDLNRIELGVTGPAPVVVLAGDVLSGGRQDRLVLADVLLTPERPEALLPVLCAEPDRWVGHRQFTAVVTTATFGLKRWWTVNGLEAERMYALQRGLWEAVDSLDALGGVPSVWVTTGEGTRPELRALQAGLLQLVHLSPASRGAAVLLDGRLLGLEVLPSAQAFRRQWPAMVDSLVLELAATPARVPPQTPVPVADLLTDVARGRVQRMRQPGAGEHWRLTSTLAAGHALTQDDRLVHLSLVSTHPNGWPPAAP
jgi:ARG/rhodanese/phosphatase superfamily protein